MSISFDSIVDTSPLVFARVLNFSSRNRCRARRAHFTISSRDFSLDAAIVALRAFHEAENHRGTTRTC
jgi:hypothetical protein